MEFREIENNLREICSGLDQLYAERGSAAAESRHWAKVAGRTWSTAREIVGAAARARAGPASSPSPDIPEPPAAVQTTPEWHYADAGQVAGPFSEEQMRQWFSEGRLPEDTLVWNQSLPDWRSAKDAGLVSAAPPAAAPTRICNSCGAVLRPRAVFCAGCGIRVPQENRCPACSAILRPGARFCPGCGQKAPPISTKSV